MSQRLAHNASATRYVDGATWRVVSGGAGTLERKQNGRDLFAPGHSRGRDAFEQRV